MSENDELPQWSAAAGQSAAHYVQPSEPRRGRGVLFGLLGIAALLGMAALGYFIAQSRSDSTETSADPAAPTAEQDEAASGVSSGDSDSSDGEAFAADGDDDTLTVDVDESDETSGDDQDNQDNGDDEEPAAEVIDGRQSERTAVLRGGTVYLQGRVPSQEIIDAIVARAAAVIGAENVVVEYEIDPTVPFDPGESTPLYVEDVVLFPFNSADIDPRFYPLLDLGVLLLSQNPNATITVVTRTDAVGSEEVNLEMATERAESIIEYWAAKGIDRERIIADPRGEELATENADETQAAQERRAEFIITGFLE